MLRLFCSGKSRPNLRPRWSLPEIYFPIIYLAGFWWIQVLVSLRFMQNQVCFPHQSLEYAKFSGLLLQPANWCYYGFLSCQPYSCLTEPINRIFQFTSKLAAYTLYSSLFDWISTDCGVPLKEKPNRKRGSVYWGCIAEWNTLFRTKGSAEWRSYSLWDARLLLFRVNAKSWGLVE